MATEHISPRYVDLDSWSSAEMIEAMYEGQLAAAAAVRNALKAIAAAVDDAVPALQRGGRLVYAGAGTSARIGVQDGSELLPTYDWPSDRLVFLMAGGLGALVQSVEGAEDDAAEGVRAVADNRIGGDDVVIGIAASGTTPFTMGVLRAARAAGAVTIALANNPEAPLFSVARHAIMVETGTEVIAGSTRMKAGTATKLILNRITTGAMIRLGKTFGNLMVDMRATNVKLVDRSQRIVMEVCDVDRDTAKQLIENAGGVVKTAIAMHYLGGSRANAEQALENAGGVIRKAIGRNPPPVR